MPITSASDNPLACSDDWRIIFKGPVAAVPLPVDDDKDPRPWASTVTNALLAGYPDVDSDTASTLADTLVDAALDSRTRKPLFAFSFCPDPTSGELARIELRQIVALPDQREPTLDALRDYFAMSTPDGIDEPEIVYGDLRIGRTVRVRRKFAAATDEFGDALVVQTVVYVTCPENPVRLDCAVVLFMSWTAVPHSERLFELADQLAETLRLRPRK
ncbi:MAG: hypothetical protein JO362_00295 [Streptomycetaceae bacterium]|nr:hypothetical protein [Streptomycetaceae bacterium]